MRLPSSDPNFSTPVYQSQAATTLSPSQLLIPYCEYIAAASDHEPQGDTPTRSSSTHYVAISSTHYVAITCYKDDRNGHTVLGRVQGLD